MKLKFATSLALAACLTSVACLSADAQSKSPKRGIAYDLTNTSDLSALSPGIGWWYNWGSAPNSGIPGNYASTYGAIYYPMIWDANFSKTTVESFLFAHPEVKYLLVLNEPNVSGQARCGAVSTGYCRPADAAALWPQIETIAKDTGVQIVGPQITYGTDPMYGNPVTWMKAFYSAYESANGGRQPRIDYLGYHWYDYGLDGQLTTMAQFNKPFWVTEFANWHSQNDGAQIDTLAKQEAQMTGMVNDLEGRGDVLRYSWFTGRVSPDPHFDSLLGATGQLTALGQQYITMPFTAPPTPVLIDAGSATAQGKYVADGSFSGGTAASTTNTVTLDSTIDTASQAVYQSNRYGNFTYKIGGFAAGSQHIVKLHFAETWWTATGTRLFNVSINGAQVLTNYDIVLAAGTANKARVETFSVVVPASPNNQITVQFTNVKDNAQVNGIEIE